MWLRTWNAWPDAMQVLDRADEPNGKILFGRSVRDAEKQAGGPFKPCDEITAQAGAKLV